MKVSQQDLNECANVFGAPVNQDRALVGISINSYKRLTGQQMKPAEEAKSYGFKSLTQVAEIFGCTTKALRDWHKHNHKRFIIVLMGCKQYLESEK